MDDNKRLDDELEQVSGGRRLPFAKKQQTIRLAEIAAEKIPLKVLKSVEGMESDVEILKKFAQQGVDVEAFEKQLPDDLLNSISGGYEDFWDDSVYCPNCNNADKERISYQYWATITNHHAVYRCRNCEKFFHKIEYGLMREGK